MISSVRSTLHSYKGLSQTCRKQCLSSYCQGCATAFNIPKFNSTQPSFPKSSLPDSCSILQPPVILSVKIACDSEGQNRNLQRAEFDIDPKLVGNTGFSCFTHNPSRSSLGLDQPTQQQPIQYPRLPLRFHCRPPTSHSTLVHTSPYFTQPCQHCDN